MTPLHPAADEQGDDPVDRDRRQEGAQPAGAGVCLESLFRTEAPRLLRYLARRTGGREEAQDLVQDVFARLLRLSRSQLDELERPESYLRIITRNLLRDRARQAKRKPPHLHLVGYEETLPTHDQQRHLESRDTLNRVEAAILRLKPRTRDIFVAHRVHGLSYAEIAERTGLSEKGVEKQMAKAIAQIGRSMSRF